MRPVAHRVERVRIEDWASGHLVGAHAATDFDDGCPLFALADPELSARRRNAGRLRCWNLRITMSSGLPACCFVKQAIKSRSE